ncbi:hypothetical protein SAMN04487905_10875 [Actinopolyspora xinjiangensis]|uniref:Uncharacterized protein n=1 Tax=Actinopolyspora xinjiangensis TaxID=405564 RepID=A0A1H0V875_9ACTN|nr:hypothetical protein [Actinopolyspora xinjiangensis]SDP74607.1 hypothetical protein SAMN04487905_10875 [Actinopolyspora xinjiangensis]
MPSDSRTHAPAMPPLELALELPDPAHDVAGSLDQELAEQRVGEEAVVTGMPGISTIHCLTSRAAPFQLPTL